LNDKKHAIIKRVTNPISCAENGTITRVPALQVRVTNKKNEISTGFIYDSLELNVLA